MAKHLTAFNLAAAEAGGKICTRDERLVVYGGYDAAASTNQRVAVWIVGVDMSHTPAQYPENGLIGGQQNPADLFMYTEDVQQYANVITGDGNQLIMAPQLFDSEQDAIDLGQSQYPGYKETVPVTIVK